VASDIDYDQLNVARKNGKNLPFKDAIRFEKSDFFSEDSVPEVPGIVVLNPPYGERIETAGVAGPSGSRESAQTEDGGDFFAQLATHWKKNYAGWTAWMLTPDLKLPSRMRFKESRRVPMWNGPIECRMFRFDLRAGSMRDKPAVK
jgi:putative N6-adenine-specific DNA methylase